MHRIRILLESSPHIVRHRPLTEAELQAFEQTLPGPLPAGVRALLGFAKGFETKGEPVSFAGECYREGYDLEQFTLPYAIPLMKDVCGDVWAVDVHRNGSWNDIFYVCHDPPCVMKQFESLYDFVAAFINGAIDPTSLRRDWLDKAMKAGPGLPQAEALASDDASMRTFAESLPEDYQIFDLRSGSPLNAFEWGLDQEIRRQGEELIFAVQDVKPRRGMLSRLLSIFKQPG